MLFLRHGLGTLVLVLLLAGAVQAKERDRYYFSGSLGWTATSKSDFTYSSLGEVGRSESGKASYSDTFHIEGAFGRRWSDHWRTELEISWRNASVDKLTFSQGSLSNSSGDIDTWGVLINGYYDFRPDHTMRPYISGGIGFANHSITLTLDQRNVSGSDIVYAWQVGAGVTFDWALMLQPFVGYRYFTTDDAGRSSTGYSAHELRFGILYPF